MDKKKYKIGDKVRIKNIKYKDSTLYVFGINPNMECYANKVLTISDIYCSNSNPEYITYHMVEDKGLWSWSISMFAPSYSKNFIDLNLVI